MKYLLFAGLLLFLSAAAFAYDSNMEGFGFGFTPSMWVEYFSPHSFAGTSDNIFYFQTKYPGSINASFHFLSTYSEVITIWGYNVSGSSGTWYEGNTISFNNDDLNANLSAASNVGIFKLVIWNPVAIFPETSYITYLTNEYGQRSYIAGTSYISPVINRYSPGVVNYALDPDITAILNSNNDSAFYNHPLKLACDADPGIQLINAGNSWGYIAFGFYNFYVNVSPSSDLNFSFVTPGNPIAVPLNVVQNFSIMVNNPLGPTGIAWYVDGGLVNVGDASNTRYSFSKSVPGTYLLEVQIENVPCSQYRTHAWTVTVGAPVSVIGTISDSFTYDDISGVDVALSCSGVTLKTVKTGINGSYLLTGLVSNKDYTITASKDGYRSDSRSKNFNASGTYREDFVLDPSNISSAGVSLRISNLSNQSNGDLVWIWATYRNGSYNIHGNCSYYGSGILPTSGELTDLGSEYTDLVEVNGSGSGSYTIVCSKLPYFPALSASDSFGISTVEDRYSAVIWETISSPIQKGLTGSYIVRFVDASGSLLSGGFCSIDFDGSMYSMSESSSGVYSIQHIFSSSGTFAVNVNCSKSGYASADSDTAIVRVSDSTTPTTILSHCFDGSKNYGESDTDCGGPCAACGTNKRCNYNADCVSSYCYAGRCSNPSCSDGIKNGRETGIDCGGVCPDCACFVNWDCDLLGSEHCSGSVCVKDSCPCSSLNWYSSSYGYYSRSRYCVNDSCSFFNVRNASNGSADYSITVSGLSGLSANVSGVSVLVGNCEDRSNGFLVVSSVPTQKYFYFSAPLVSLSPSVSPSSASSAFGLDGFYSDSSQIISRLCEIPSGQDRIYSLTSFQVRQAGGDIRTVSAYSLTFRNRFRVNATWGDVSGVATIFLNGSRNMSCKFRGAFADEWSNISVEGWNIYLYNVSQGAYTFFCQSQYGEGFKFEFGRGGMAQQVFNEGWGLISAVGASFFTIFTGSDFVWMPWLIIPLALLIVLGLPLMIVVGYFAMSYQRSKNNGGK